MFAFLPTLGVAEMFLLVVLGLSLYGRDAIEFITDWTTAQFRR